MEEACPRRDHKAGVSSSVSEPKSCAWGGDTEVVQKSEIWISGRDFCVRPLMSPCPSQPPQGTASVAALRGSSKAARGRALLPFPKSAWSDAASWYRMCGISGAKGLNLYTILLNKHWLYPCLVWQSTRARPKLNIQNAFRKWIDTQRQIFGCCKLALEIQRERLVCAEWGHGLLSLGKWTEWRLAINPCSGSLGNIWDQRSANQWPRGAQRNVKVGLASVLYPLTPNLCSNSDDNLALPGETILLDG